MKLEGGFSSERIGIGILCLLSQVQQEMEIPEPLVRMFIKAQSHIPWLPSTEMSIFNAYPRKNLFHRAVSLDPIAKK